MWWNRRGKRRTTTRTGHGRLAGAAAAVTAAAALGLALTGCDTGGDAAAKDPKGAGSGPSVIAPGRPGEAARTLSPEEAATAAGDDAPNAADLGYVRRMVEHHRQALTMAALAPDRAGSADVRRLAERVRATQGPEIDAMEGWLRVNGGGAATGGHDHGAMPGMATDRQLAALRAARGGAFDTLFLKLMTAHHSGAVAMATEVLAQGDSVRVEEMADDVVAEQSAEIERMRRLS